MFADAPPSFFFFLLLLSSSSLSFSHALSLSFFSLSFLFLFSFSVFLPSSAWRGWRPLAVDPHAPPGAPASRDHVISENPETGVIFIAGGKWTTWREMAEHVIDKVTDKKCTTKEISLLGGDMWTENLPIKLVQKHSCSVEVATHLAKT